MRPQVAGIGGSFPAAGNAEGLAGVAAAQHIDRRDRRPVHGGDVPEVGHARVVVGQDRGGTGIGVGDPYRLDVQDGGDRHVQAAVAGAH
nr:hypothetical protein [Actinomadura rudentiformis]